MDVIDKMTPEQALDVVRRLVRKGGTVREAVVAEATAVLTEIDVPGAADEVFDALDLIDVQDYWDRSGRSRDGYTSPDEAAAEIVEEELQPYIDQIERYHALGMLDQEAVYCMGVIWGVYRYERESKSEFRSWSVDAPSECAGSLLEDWRERNRDAARVAAMDEFIRERCPEWAKWLKDAKV
jgi:hypothetical protein